MARLDWQRFGINDVSKYDYIVGIDFGHRQMSAHCVRLSENRCEPARVYLDHNEHSVIPTQFAVDGNDIILGDIRGYEHQYIYFKRNPEELNNGYLYSDEDITCKELVQKFIGEIITNIEAHNADLLNKEILYIVGCPSGDEWFRNNNDVEYAKILRGGIDRDIVVMHESRGALIKLKNEQGISFDRKQGILVYDFGSSTADWTFMYTDENGVVRMLDDTARLGASKIDMKIMDVILKSHNNTKNNLAYRVTAQIDTIGEKEAAYDSYGRGNQIKHRVFYEFKNGDEISQNINEELLEIVTGKEKISYTTANDGEISGTWEELCRKFMNDANKRIHNELPGITIKNIMLTGGASKMYFIKDICKEVFNCTDEDIIIDGEPSACVSKGLAYAGQADVESQLLAETVYSNIRAYLKSDKDGDTCSETLGKVIANEVAKDEVFYENVLMRALKEWASGKITDLSAQSTVRHLMKMTDDYGKDELQKLYVKEKMKTAVNAVIEYYVDYVKGKLSEIYQKQYNTEIPDSLNIDLSSSIKDLTKVVANMDIHFLSSTSVKRLLGISDGEMVNMDALRYLDKGNWAGGAFESRLGLYNNYKNNESSRKEAAKVQMINYFYNEIKDKTAIQELSKKLEERIIDGIDEVIDSMALYAKK